MSCNLAKKLFQTILRAFYSDYEIAIGDYLISHDYMNDEKLEEYIDLSQNLIRGSLILLEKHRLIQKERIPKVETKENGLTKVGREEIYWYVDLHLFVNVVKYRLHLMSEKIRQQEASERANNGISYKCTNENCGKLFTTQEVLAYCNPGQPFFCDQCKSKLVSEDSQQNANSLLSLLQKVQKQIEHDDPERHKTGLVAYLAQLENKELPRRKPSDIIKEKHLLEDVEKSNSLDKRFADARVIHELDPREIKIQLDDNNKNITNKPAFVFRGNEVPDFLQKSSVKTREKFDIYMKNKSDEVKEAEFKDIYEDGEQYNEQLSQENDEIPAVNHTIQDIDEDTYNKYYNFFKSQTK
ncbi:hypothetical protein WA158_001349 [Blastocystis sp. Blastoise]